MIPGSRMRCAELNSCCPPRSTGWSGRTRTGGARRLALLYSALWRVNCRLKYLAFVSFVFTCIYFNTKEIIFVRTLGVSAKLPRGVTDEEKSHSSRIRSGPPGACVQKEDGLLWGLACETRGGSDPSACRASHQLEKKAPHASLSYACSPRIGLPRYCSGPKLESSSSDTSCARRVRVRVS